MNFPLANASARALYKRAMHGGAFPTPQHAGGIPTPVKPVTPLPSSQIDSTVNVQPALYTTTPRPPTPDIPTYPGRGDLLNSRTGRQPALPPAPPPLLPRPPALEQEANTYVNQLAPEGQRWFQNHARQSMLGTAGTHQALQAENRLFQAEPNANPLTFQEQLSNWRQSSQPNTPEPQGPNYERLLETYGGLPPEQQEALREWQAYQIANWNDGEASPQSTFQNPFAAGTPSRFIFPHRNPLANRSEVYNPEEYHNLHELASAQGVDIRNQHFRNWWQQQQNSHNIQPGRGVVQPQNLLSAYRNQTNQQTDNHVNQAAPNWFKAMENFFGGRRIDPQTGSERIIPIGPFTRNNPYTQGGPGAAAEALGNTVSTALPSNWLNIARTALPIASDAIDGQQSATHAFARDVFAVPNRIMGTNMFGDVDMRPGQYRQGGAYHGLGGPAGARNTFFEHRDPLLGTQPSLTGTHQSGHQRSANAPDANPASRLYHNTMASMYGSAPAAASIASMRIPGLSAAAGGMAVNPIYHAPGQAIRQTPLGGDTNVGTRLTDLANYTRREVPGFGGQALGALAEMLPDLAGGAAMARPQQAVGSLLARNAPGLNALSAQAANLASRSRTPVLRRAQADQLTPAAIRNLGNLPGIRRFTAQQLGFGVLGSGAAGLFDDRPPSPEEHTTVSGTQDRTYKKLVADQVQGAATSGEGIASPQLRGYLEANPQLGDIAERLTQNFHRWRGGSLSEQQTSDANYLRQNMGPKPPVLRSTPMDDITHWGSQGVSERTQAYNQERLQELVAQNEALPESQRVPLKRLRELAWRQVLEQEQRRRRQELDQGVQE